MNLSYTNLKHQNSKHTSTQLEVEGGHVPQCPVAGVAIARTGKYTVGIQQ